MEQGLPPDHWILKSLELIGDVGSRVPVLLGEKYSWAIYLEIGEAEMETPAMSRSTG
jgi:hypothetical protein